MKDIFDYPLDCAFIIRKQKSLKKELLKEKNLIEKRIAILGGSTTHHIVSILEIFLLAKGIKPVFYESDYNKYYEEIMFEDNLKEFKPDIVYIHTTYRNLLYMPTMNDDLEKVNEKVELEFSRLKDMWSKLKSTLQCEVIQNNFEYPRNRSLGNLDCYLQVGTTNYINRLNAKMSEYVVNQKGILLNDINYLAAWIGLEKWHDLNFWYSYKYALSYEAIPHLAKNLTQIISARFGKNAKCLVLDLDNTLWGGVIGDDGKENIKIGKETPIGEAYTDFQIYIKALKDRGIALAIASKNDYENAIDGLQHPEMILHKDDFINIKANWGEKSSNIIDIAKEINIGVDAIVFIDDNAVERELVTSQVKGVNIPNIGDNIEHFIDYIDKNGYFETISISQEDIKRNDYYRQNTERQEIERSYDTYEDFLKALDMFCEIATFKEVYLERIAQLVNKTNQFNLTTKRYTYGEIVELYKNEKYLTLYGKLRDKFGDNGLVSIIIGEIKEDSLYIDLWVMSCRVMKRDMEYAMFDELIEQCRQRGIKNIYGKYIKSAKNSMVEFLYKDLGFEIVEKTDNDSIWKIEINKQINKKNNVIKKESIN